MVRMTVPSLSVWVVLLRGATSDGSNVLPKSTSYIFSTVSRSREGDPNFAAKRAYE
jgi:hypothetical protein